jgi:hypothetical protein
MLKPTVEILSDILNTPPDPDNTSGETAGKKKVTKPVT